MNVLDYVVKKYKIDLATKSPIEIPNVGRNDLAILLPELDFKIGAEVGVECGAYSEILCKANPQMKIYGVDPWLVVKNYLWYSQEDLDAAYVTAKQRLASYSNYEIIKDFSMDAIKKITNESLDFVYIDANHEDPYITQDIVEWSKKIRSGGIISGHDYMRPKRNGRNDFHVIRATNKYTQDNNIKPWFILGLNAKVPGLVRDRSRSWFWIKP